LNLYEETKRITNRRESVTGVRDKQTSLSNGTITNCDTLDEPGTTHFRT